MKTLTESWYDVEDRIVEAKLVAFDGCHKIYLAMDDTEADWFRLNYDIRHEGTPEEMLAIVRRWFDESCPLRFINAVTHNAENPNAGYEGLIEQGATDEEECCPSCGEPVSWCQYEECLDDADDEEDE